MNDSDIKFGTRYSKFEDKTIRDMLDEGKTTFEIAKTLHRPLGGVEKRISEFILNKRTSRASGNVRFEEIDKIIDLYMSGKSIGYIVNETHRSDRSVKRITYIVDYVKNKIRKDEFADDE